MKGPIQREGVIFFCKEKKGRVVCSKCDEIVDYSIDNSYRIIPQEQQAKKIKDFETLNLRRPRTLLRTS